MKPCFYKATICILFKWFYLNCGQEVRMNKFNKHIYGVPYIVNLTRLFIILSNKDKTNNASWRYLNNLIKNTVD